MFKTFFTSESKEMGSLVWLLLLCVLFITDIFSRNLLFHQDISLVPGLGIHGFANYHFAFSIILPTFVMYAIYLAVCVFMLWFIFKNWHGFTFAQRVSWLLVVAGASVNLVERMYLGYVRDFIQIGTGYINLGDAYIIFGVLYLLYHNLRYQRTI